MTSSKRPYYSEGTDLTFTMLSREEETRLFTEARSGDEGARTFLLQNHMLFAAMHARRLSKGRLPDEEVLSGANLALMKAFGGFDHTRGNRFTSYLKPFIQGEISALWKRFFREEGEELVSPDQPDKTPSENPFEEQDAAEHQGFMVSLMSGLKNVLNEHETEIVNRHYFAEESFADIARSRGVSREAIRASHARALVKLKKAFGKKGITGLQ